MGRPALRWDILLLITATIWGLAFVAQRVGMEYIGPYLYNGIRFALGAAVLVPLIFYQGRKKTRSKGKDDLHPLLPGLLLGLVLFIAASLQQVGISMTTAGNAGFITGLYVIFVPIIGILFHNKTHKGNWIGALLAVIGLYLLTGATSALNKGDTLVLIGSLLWAIHVLLIARYAPRSDPLRLAAIQFMVCSLLSMGVALATEPIILSALIPALPAILYGGILSVGIAYSLQIIAQQHAPPAHAAILLSLESAFAAIGGWLILGEQWTSLALLGALLMLLGVILSQLSSPTIAEEPI